MSRNLLTPLILLLLCAPLVIGQVSVLYGSDASTDDLGSIDRSTGAWTTIGNQAVIGSIAGLAYDPAQDVLYGTNPTDHALYVIDQTTGLATYVGPTGFSQVTGLAFDSTNGVLYCSCSSCNVLFTVNVNTGAGSYVASFYGTSNVQGLAYDPAADKLYGLSDTADAVFIVNRNTGMVYFLPSPLGVAGSWRGLTWDSDLGVLFATRASPGEMYAVDPATGVATYVGPSQPDVGGLAFRPGSPPEYQVDQTGAAMNIDGVLGTPFVFAAVTLATGQPTTVTFESVNAGLPWDLAISLAPLLPASQGAPQAGGQILNVDLFDPSSSLLWSGFQGPPFATATLPFSLPAPGALSIQMAVIDPVAAIGVSLSQPTRIIVQ